ncbi:peroxidase 31-like, partial [Phalaenopsis equestris]|uniref:peroxidase 31-like n=1 Tax=Phalaenopsis equestris TaxID=78828 RepID=UPI0009E4342C
FKFKLCTHAAGKKKVEISLAYVGGTILSHLNIVELVREVTTITEEFCVKKSDTSLIDITRRKFNVTPTTGIGVLRLFFHDCFLSGCDISTLISSNAFNKAEHDAEINLYLLGDAFGAIVSNKTSLELQCLAIVFCADILLPYNHLLAERGK